MITKIKARLDGDQGFTLIELLVVLNILGILTAMAVPAYIGFRSRAEAAAASANVRSAVPAAEAYYVVPGSYAGLTAAALRLQTPGIDPSSGFKAGPNAANNGYCVQDTSGAITYSYTGGIGGTAILTAAPCDGVTYTVA